MIANSKISAGRYEIDVVGSRDCMWTYRAADGMTEIAPPCVQSDGKELILELSGVILESDVEVFSGVREVRFLSDIAGVPNLHLTLRFRVAAESSVARFSYLLRSDGAACLTRNGGADSLRYFSIPVDDQAHFQEVRLSDFDELIHSYRPVEEPIDSSDFENSSAFMGPILCVENEAGSFLIAYEHGSQAPKRFLEYRL